MSDRSWRPDVVSAADPRKARVLPYGDRAALVELAAAADVLPLRDALVGVAGLGELVPAARTLLVPFDSAVFDLERLSRLVEDVDVGASAPPASVAPIALAVRYDGADLDRVAASVGCSVAEVISRHISATYTVAFCGFAPGFAYLSGLHPSLHLPRLARPRTSVPAGSVGIAGEFTGVYPRPSPGGWQLLGRTDAALWDLNRDPPALLVPGLRVRFENA